MRTYIDQLLESRHLTSPLPFWKLHLTDSEVNELVEYINDCFRKRRYSANFENEEFSRELCLLCGLWWNKKYDGGRQNHRRVLSDYNIDITEKETTQVRKIIKEGVSQLGIRVHQTDFQNRYLDSVYAQGGLPMQLMANEETKSSFENFIGKLIIRLEEIAPIEREKHSLEFARNVANTYLNNETLKRSEAVMEFAVEVANAYFSDEDTFDDYEIIRNIINKIRTRSNTSKKSQQFRADWYFRISGDYLSLFYWLDGPSVLPTKSGEGIPAPLSVLVNGQYVASYYESGDRYVIMPGARLRCLFACANPTSILDFKAMRGDVQYNYQLFNAEPPYLEEPLLLRFDSQRQSYGRKGDGNYACLMPQGWDCQALPNGRPVTLGDRQFLWVDGLAAETVNEGALEFRNTETDETLRMDKSTSDVSVLFTPSCEDWIEQSSDTLAMNESDIRRRFFFYRFNDNDDGVNLQRRSFTFWYRLQCERNFREYTGGTLSDGRITMQVRDRDGRNVKTFRFVNLHDLSYTKANDTVTLTYPNGACALLAGQEHIEKQSSDIYTVAEVNRSEAIAAANIHFRILSCDCQPLADIAVPSPLRKNGFATLDGEPLPNGARIAYDELYKYQAVLTKNQDIIIEFQKEKFNDENKNNNRIKKREYKTALRKRESCRSGNYTLDRFREIIDRCIAIYGFGKNNKRICLSIGESQCVYIYRNSYKAFKSKDENGPYVGVTTDGSRDLVSGLQLLAIPLGVHSEMSPLYHNDEIVLREFGTTGRYYLPKEYVQEGYPFKVVSDNNRNQGSLLPYNFAPYDDGKRRNYKEEIDRFTTLLQNENQDEWRDVWFYLGVVIRYRLPYDSFDALRAVASDPYLLAYMITHIGSELTYDINTVVSELQRMESELGFAFHYIPIECWKQMRERIGTTYDNIQENIDLSLDNKDAYINKFLNVLEELLRRQFGGECFTAIFNRLIGGVSFALDYEQMPKYYEQTNSAIESFSVFNTPNKLFYPRLERQPQPCWRDCIEICQRLQFLAIAMPQSAAQYAHGADMELWKDDKNFIRRMINYMSIYTPNLYKELFFIALLREPVIQKRIIKQ